MKSCVLTAFKLSTLSPDCSQHCAAVRMQQRDSVCAQTMFIFLFPFFFLAVCQILPKGVVSVIGPASSPASGSTVSHICGEKEVSVC